MNPVALARPDLLDFVPYQSAQPGNDLIRLHANESAWRHDWDTTGAGLNRYPDPRPRALIERLASVYGVETDEVLLTRGSDDGIDLLTRAFCRPGEDRVVVCPPTFGMYAIAAKLQGVPVDAVPLQREQGFALDASRVLSTARRGAKLVFLCSPNNPTGNSMPPALVADICRGLEDRAMIIVDEAYAEFSSAPSLATIRRDHPNLVLLRTLSKAHALAGARLGVVLADREVIRLLRAVMPPYPIPSPSLEAAGRLLEKENLERTKREVDRTVESREAMMTALASCPAVTRVWPSEANFLLVQCRDPDAALNACRRSGLLIRDLSRQDDLQDCVRITVGSDEQNRSLIAAFEEIDS